MITQTVLIEWQCVNIKFNIIFLKLQLRVNQFFRFLNKIILFGRLTLLVLVPDPDEPVVLAGRGEEGPVAGEGQVLDGVGRPGLPEAGPAGAGGGIAVADGKTHLV